MRIIPPRTLRLGRLIASFSRYEMVFVYTGRDRIHIKTIRRGLTPLPMKTAVAITLASLVIAMGFLFAPIREKNAYEEDDAVKNALLKSAQTDFTDPEESNSLVVRKHRVKQGETLGSIARNYGVSVDTICGSSKLQSYDVIRVGTELSIPSRDGILYTMTQGSSIVAVAQKYNISLQKILAENNLKNADFIKTGSVLFIPDAKPQDIFNGFLWPARSRVITCGYGWRRNPFNSGYREFHPGMDIRARYENVMASKYGKVTYTGWLGGYGKAVIIAHPGGWKTLYAHLSQISVRPGQYVKQGQVIARSGNTGRSTGAHLHFEILKDGGHKNPYSYLRK
jgi:murein DD-endopeptidase MepM/ murein hydrolase activator NlpD